MPYCFFGSSIKFQGHTGWKIDDLIPIWVRLLGRSQLSNPSDLPCLIIPPASTKLIGGVYWYHLVRLSVCPSVRLSVCSSVDRIVSALYLQQYSSDPFYICTSYQATSEGVSRVMPVSKLKNLRFWGIRKICKFDFVIFWHWDPIWLNGMGNHEAAGGILRTQAF